MCFSCLLWVSIQRVPLCFACVFICLTFLFRASPCCVLPVYCGFLSRPSPWSVCLCVYLFLISIQSVPLLCFIYLLLVSIKTLPLLCCTCVFIVCFCPDRPLSFVLPLCIVWFLSRTSPLFLFFSHFCCLLQINESMFLNSFSYSSCQINISHYHNSHML
jgi:hypothetical protein